MRAYMLIILSVAACAASGDDQLLDVVFDPCSPVVLVPADDATAQEIAGIDDAIAMWNSVLDTQLGRGAVAGAPELPIAFQDGSLIVRGVYEDELGQIVVNRRLAGHDRAVTIAHELGHALGLWHVGADIRTSVMNPGNMITEPNAADAAELRAIWGACAPPPTTTTTTPARR